MRGSFFQYKNFLSTLERLKKAGADVFIIGESLLGQPIYCVKAGTEGMNVIVSGGIHAREHFTSELVLALAEESIVKGVKGVVYFVPVVNPDGVRLSTEGISFLPEVIPQREQAVLKAQELIRLNRNERDFSLWKANAAGVDLNVNFDADWGKGRKNVFYPRSSDYVGLYPLSESESKALAAFTLKVRPAVTLSYHTKGEVIYWYFNQRERRLWRDYSLAKKIARQTGYSLTGREGSAGGYKDWCVKTLKIPSFTIEVAPDTLKHPVSIDFLPSALRQNHGVIDIAAEYAESRTGKNIPED